MIDIDPKLTKIVALAREGIGGEKETAIRTVRRICEREGLDFDDVMHATDEREYMLEVPFKGKTEESIVVQVCWKFAVTEKNPGLRTNRRAKVFFYTTTPSKHIETVNAAKIYLNAFRKEHKKFMDDLIEAFVHKHRLYGTTSSERPHVPMTLEKLQKVERMLNIARGMDDVHIRKSLGDGK